MPFDSGNEPHVVWSEKGVILLLADTEIPIAGVAKLKLFSFFAVFLAGNLAALPKKPPNFLRAISSYF